MDKNANQDKTEKGTNQDNKKKDTTTQDNKNNNTTLKQKLEPLTNNTPCYESDNFFIFWA
jgi:hypothetical protein